MKKIAIITYHNLNNYGTMLQAYALQKKIEDMKYDVRLIDYSLDDKKKTKKDKIFTYLKLLKKNPKRINYYIKRAFNKRNEQLQIHKFQEFYKSKMNLTEKFQTEKSLISIGDKYDVYIVGSDQTWNPYFEIASNVYLLSFVGKNKIKASYAPSIGVKYISEEKLAYMKKYLSFFDYLSCRDLNGAKLLSKKLERKVELVVDPTLLLTNNEWLEIATEYSNPNKYILCYSLGEKDECRSYADYLGEKYGYEVVHIYTNLKCISKGRKILYDVGPAEFVTLISNAEIICTDSFHATIFSINFNKQFYSFCKNEDIEGSDNQRLKDVLKEYNIENRLVTDVYNVSDDKIKYEIVNEILENKVKHSMKYLKQILESDKDE